MQAFAFKQKSHDFVVEEQLPFVLSGQGDAFFVYIEKRNLNTMDVVQHLCSSLKLSRMAIGIAGLKDKRAITRQRFSIYKRALQRVGGPKAFLACLRQCVTVLETTWHDTPLNMSTPITNTFAIRLRATKKLGRTEKAAAKQGIEQLFATGFPNYFGDQRFGVRGRNRKQGKALLTGKSDVTDHKEIIFKLQAYSSKIFNDYLIQRAKGGLALLDGDIISYTDHNDQQARAVYRKKLNAIQPFVLTHSKAFFHYPQQLEPEQPFDPKTMSVTGPIIGCNSLLCKTTSVAGKLEQSFLKQKQLTEKRLGIYRKRKIYGLRRALWVTPTATKVTYQGDDLLIRFSLSSGCYASVLIDMMLERLKRH